MEGFYRGVAYSKLISKLCNSCNGHVCPSVCHTPVLYQNEQTITSLADSPTTTVLAISGSSRNSKEFTPNVFKQSVSNIINSGHFILPPKCVSKFQTDDGEVGCDSLQSDVDEAERQITGARGAPCPSQRKLHRRRNTRVSTARARTTPADDDSRCSRPGVNLVGVELGGTDRRRLE